MQNAQLKFLFVMIGSAILIGLSGLLVGVSLFSAFPNYIVVGVLMAIVSIGILYQFFEEIKSILKIDRATVSWGIPDLYIFAAVVIGAVLTFALCKQILLSAVVSAALVGVLAALFAPKYAVPAYCGAFVGMVSTALATNYGLLLIAAIIAGAVFLMGKLVFNGFGGKLGTIAFCGCLAMIYLSGQAPTVGAIIWGTDALIILVAAIIGTVATYFISIRLNHGAVLASGIVGLVGGLVLPVLFPGIGSLSALFLSATFAGMSAKARFDSELQMVLVGAIVGGVFIFSSPYGNGAGGKLGTIAFASAIAASGLIKLGKLGLGKKAA